MTDTTNTTLLDQMINNLGVTSKITTDDRNKLEKLKFSEYSNELRNADIEIGAQNIDNDLKIELLKLQVHYLHNLETIKGMKFANEICTKANEICTKKLPQLEDKLKNASATEAHLQRELLEKSTRLNNVLAENTTGLNETRKLLADRDAQIAVVKGKLDAVQTENSKTQAELTKARTELADRDAQIAVVKGKLDAVQTENSKTQAELTKALTELGDLRKKYNTLNTLYKELEAKLQAKLHELTRTSVSKQHLSSLTHQSHQNPSAMPYTAVSTQSPNGTIRRQPQQTQFVLKENPDLNMLISALTLAQKGLAKNDDKSILPYTSFKSMFDYIKDYKNEINTLLSNLQKTSSNYIYTYLTKSQNPYAITITIKDITIPDPDSKNNLIISIDNKTYKHSIVYDNESISNVVITRVDPAMAINSNKYKDIFIKSYKAILVLLDIIYTEPLRTYVEQLKKSGNKYLKYKNKYLQLKKLYNL